ncbi:MAG: peptidyl-prolyl cis-trans isomerase [Calditrichaeota bacterium]|nr:peptidyl-prolyl cis-trans isomerase [Calditrichota bacterium]
MRRIVPLIFVLLMLAACSSDQPKPGEIVARVGDTYLLRDVVLQLIPESLSGSEREFFIKKIVEQWVDSHTFAAAAVEDGIALNTRDRWQIEKLEAEMLANHYLNMKVRNDFPVTDREIEDYYTANPEQFRRSKDEVHLVHLFFEQLDNAIVDEIKSSKDLLEVIEKNYLDTQITRSVEPNGDLGFLPVEQIRPEFQKAIRGTKTGLIYGPVKTGLGYHYLQVIDRQPAESIRSLSLVTPEIRNLLIAAKRHDLIRDAKESARKNFKAETFYENIL